MSNIFETISKGIKNWWIPMVVGFLLVALGIFLFTQPDLTYAAESFIFAVSFFFIGGAELYFAIDNRENLQGWGWYLTGGIIAILIGGVLIANPQMTEAIFPYVVAILLLFRSIQGLGLSFDMKSYGILDWGNLAIASVLGILFSFVLLIYPMLAEAFLITFAGLAFIFVGIVGIVLGYNLKKIKDLPKNLSKDLRDKIQNISDNIKSELSKVKSNVENSVAQAKQDVQDTVNNVKESIEDVSDDIQDIASKKDSNS